MPAKKKPRVNQQDIDNAVNELLEVLDIDSLKDFDRLFALDLLQDYGKWCGISEAAWRSIVNEGLTEQVKTGGKGNVHNKMVKSEAIGILKDARTSKTDLAMKISRFVKQGTIGKTDEVDEIDDFIRR